MTKLKFDESKVINALHTDLVKDGQTGIFANDIFVLKSRVENRDEKAFGRVNITKGQSPFHSAKAAAALFYPITIKEIFGEGYIDYLENYKLPDYEKDLSYKEFCDLIKNKNKDTKKYLFSATSKITDWMDGEVYNAEVDYGDSYGKDHGKTGKVVLVVEAPNELLAKITADIWFQDIGGYHHSGCNVYGRGWVDSKDYNSRRYFGELISDDISESIKNIKLYDTKSNYNLNGKVETIKFEDVLTSSYFKCFLRLNKKAYAFENERVINDNLSGEKSLKERVIEAFKNAGLKAAPIYYDEVDALYSDFNNTMNAIIDSIKAFEVFDKDVLSKSNRLIKKVLYKDQKFIRPEVRMNNGKDENKGLIFARSVTYHKYNSITDYYDSENTRYTTYRSWYITNKNFKISDLTKTSLVEDWLHHIKEERMASKLSALNLPVFDINDFIIVPYSYDIEYYDRENEKNVEHRAKDFFIWDKIVDGITLADLVNLRDTFKNIPGVSNDNILWDDLAISDSTFDGHKCIKVYIHIKNYNQKWEGWSDSYSPKKSFKQKYYIAFLKAMYEYGYHVVTASDQEDDKGEYGYEKLNMYFAKNRKGIDYSNTFTEEYWMENIRPSTKSMW